MNDNNSLQSNEYYKNLDKHTNCSKCDIILTQDNYKKGRTVCRVCYNNNVLTYYKNKFGSNSSIKTDVSTQTDFSDASDNTNQKIISKKQNTTIKKRRSTKKDNLIIQDTSNIKDISNNNITDADPNLLCDKLKEILSKPNMIENDYTMSKMILDELLRTKSIPKAQYKTICKNLGLK